MVLMKNRELVEVTDLPTSSSPDFRPSTSSCLFVADTLLFSLPVTSHSSPVTFPTLKERQIIAIPTPSTLNAVHCQLGFMLSDLK